MKPTCHTSVVFTNKARCRDCYRCLRACPVKAIRMKDGQAYVVEDRCIACGTCVRECPQGAKTIRSDIDRARTLLAERDTVAVSVAPSLAAAFSATERTRLASALRKLGFAFVAETAVGAYHVATRVAELASKTDAPLLCTACPAVVNYVERYAPDLVPALAGVVSPMVAHARCLKARLGNDAGVVFIGPCVAKKDEADRPGSNAVDCVLTFQELRAWLQREHINLLELEESDFDETPGPNARFFPVSGGLARTARLGTDLLDDQVIAAHGYEDISQALQALRRDGPRVLIDPLFCPQGCINGPAMDSEATSFERRRDVLAYARNRPPADEPRLPDGVDLAAVFHPQAIAADVEISEEKIQDVLRMTGKADPADQLNCGACGYDSCRDKAIAVVAGMAEIEMCIPAMRRLAEQRGDRIIDSSPNGIVILNERLQVLAMNPAFRKMFLATDDVLGKRISYLLDPEPFELLLAGAGKTVRDAVRHEKYSLVCREIYYPLDKDKQYVGLFVDVTDSTQSRQKLDDLRSRTIHQARELLEHQLRLAQQITQQLGESTAEGEALAERLMDLTDE